MARRVITPTIFEDEWFGQLPHLHMVMWFGLFGCEADDQGRLLDNPSLLRSHLFPYRDDVKLDDVRAALSCFVDAGKVIRYEVDGKGFLQVRHWWEHQKPTWASRSKHPPPDDWQDRVRSRENGKYVVHNWPGQEDENWMEEADLELRANLRANFRAGAQSPSPFPSPSPFTESDSRSNTLCEHDPEDIEIICPDSDCPARRYLVEAVAGLDGKPPSKPITAYATAFCIEAEGLSGELLPDERRPLCRRWAELVFGARFLSYHHGDKGPIKNATSYTRTLSKEPVLNETARERFRRQVRQPAA